MRCLTPSYAKGSPAVLSLHYRPVPALLNPFHPMRIKLRCMFCNVTVDHLRHARMMQMPQTMQHARLATFIVHCKDANERIQHRIEHATFVFLQSWILNFAWRVAFAPEAVAQQ